MKFTFIVRDQLGKEKKEEGNAQSETKLRELYRMMGYEVVEIIKAEKQSGMLDGIDPATLAALGTKGGAVPNMGNLNAPPPVPQKREPRYKEYEDGGIKYRVELNTGTLQKQGWVKMSADDLKAMAIEQEGKIQNAHSLKLKLFRLEWVDL